MELQTPIEPALERPEVQPPPAPQPSYAPFMLALGITMFFWGVATSPVMSAGGFAVMVGALWTWIRDIAKGWRN